MRIWLTGGRGMVGRNFLESPRATHHEILAPSREELDLLDFEAVWSWVGDVRPDIVIHAAGKVGGIQANIREPVQFLLENFDLGRNVVVASSRHGVPRLINLGSSCMYPRNAPNPLRENMVLNGELEPTNEGYALAKIAIAKLCEYVSREHSALQYKTLVPCNIYGRHDKFDPSRSHLIPAVIHKIHEAKSTNEPAVDIWGSGEARREFMYACDLVDALFEAVERFDALPATMNIGLGQDYSINDYYETVAQVLGYEGAFVHDLAKPVGMTRKLVDVSLQTQWGWSPRWTLKEGIRETYAFYLEQL